MSQLKGSEHLPSSLVGGYCAADLHAEPVLRDAVNCRCRV